MKMGVQSCHKQNLELPVTWLLSCFKMEEFTLLPLTFGPLVVCSMSSIPFIGKEFTQLANSVLSDPTPSLPGTYRKYKKKIAHQKPTNHASKMLENYMEDLCTNIKALVGRQV